MLQPQFKTTSLQHCQEEPSPEAFTVTPSSAPSVPPRLRRTSSQGPPGSGVCRASAQGKRETLVSVPALVHSISASQGAAQRRILRVRKRPPQGVTTLLPGGQRTGNAALFSHCCPSTGQSGPRNLDLLSLACTPVLHALWRLLEISPMIIPRAPPKGHLHFYLHWCPPLHHTSQVTLLSGPRLPQPWREVLELEVSEVSSSSHVL